MRGQEGFIPLEEPKYPKNLVLNITRDGQPVKYATVNIYREEMYKNTVDVTAFMKKNTGDRRLVELITGHSVQWCGRRDRIWRPL